jgi:hypothetical protein
MICEPIPCTDGVRHFPSIKAAARAKGVSPRLISYHLDTHGNMDRMGKGPHKRGGGTEPIWIRRKLYPSHTAAAEALGVSRVMISKAKRLGRLHTVGLGR